MPKLNRPISITACDLDEEQWRVIIETPKLSHNKYRYSPEFGCYQLAKVLPEGMAFPYDFGFIPSTRGEDGDPLDVLLLMDQPTFCGCLTPARLIGVIEGKQTEKNGDTERNDRLVAIPCKTRTFANIRSISDLDKHELKEIEQFFVTYNAQDGKKFELLGLHGPRRAQRLAENGMKAFKKRHGRKSKRAGRK